VASILIRDATILTMDDCQTILHGAVAIEDGVITAVGEPPDGQRFDRTIDAAGGYLLPGFVQTHVHLCQTIFRGLAEDLPLLEWLRRRVWPLEAAHSPSTLAASVRLAAAELLRSGTTTVLTMETVHDTDVVFETLAGCGLRAVVGKSLMDADEAVPRRMRETAQAAIDESLALGRRWDGAAGGRLRAAFAPRFALSCSRELLEGVAAASASGRALVHTHAAEHRDELEIVRRLSGGLSNLEYLAAVGLATSRLCAAHCVWVSDEELALLADRDVKVLHCPGSNLKLGSGLAPVVDMRRRGISVSLGADGAACNNRLDMFDEMRLAATLQAVRVAPGTLSARDVVWMATREGARALGLDDRIGSVTVGKRADLTIVDRDRPHLGPDTDPWTTLVYAARGTDVRFVIVDGDVLVEDFVLARLDARAVAAAGRAAGLAMLSRAQL
jgi:5-methylthioadenosine/S-adenosylhomocysteine deaminase